MAVADDQKRRLERRAPILAFRYFPLANMTFTPKADKATANRRSIQFSPKRARLYPGFTSHSPCKDKNRKTNADPPREECSFLHICRQILFSCSSGLSVGPWI